MPKPLSISAKITGLKYKPLLVRELSVFDIGKIATAFDAAGSFLLDFSKEQRVALSWWVSAKRTRTYPYARVYDTLGFAGKKVTIIPVFKRVF